MPNRTIILDDDRKRLATAGGEVLIDLEKYDASREELFRLRRIIEDLNRNTRYDKFVQFAAMIDHWRIFPRIFFLAYTAIFVYVIRWFMDLPDPSTQAAAFVSTITGLATAIFGLYCNSNKSPSQPKPTTSP